LETKSKFISLVFVTETLQTFYFSCEVAMSLSVSFLFEKQRQLEEKTRNKRIILLYNENRELKYIHFEKQTCRAFVVTTNKKIVLVIDMEKVPT
jgi:hypothetical protein